MAEDLQMNRKVLWIALAAVVVIGVGVVSQCGGFASQEVKVAVSCLLGSVNA